MSQVKAAGRPPETPAPGGLSPADPAGLVRERAVTLFRSRRYMCAEAILIAVNEVFDGGLTKRAAGGLAAALPEGLGGSGCLCGAVSGAALGLGLILSGKLRRREIRLLSRRLHQAFSLRHGSTCCRVLTRPVKDDPEPHFDQCTELTGFAAETAARLILEKLPKLLQAGDRAGGRLGAPGWRALLSRLLGQPGKRRP
jgi:C_GCAxxG_C_C family probable redox protein